MPRLKKPGEPPPIYEIRKDGSLWRVYDRRGIIQFTTMSRPNARDWVNAQPVQSPEAQAYWITNNSPKE